MASDVAKQADEDALAAALFAVHGRFSAEVANNLALKAGTEFARDHARQAQEMAEGATKASEEAAQQAERAAESAKEAREEAERAERAADRAR